MRQNGNLELTSAKYILWTTGTINKEVDFLYFDRDGLSLRGIDNKTIWRANNMFDEWSEKLFIQNDGNLVVYNKCDKPIWSTDTYEGKNQSLTCPSLCNISV